jgi:hypothetical protein
MSQPDDQTYDDSGRPVPSVDFEFPADEPQPEQPEVDAQQLAEFSRRLLAMILRGRDAESVQHRAQVAAFLLAPSLCHPVTTKAGLARLLHTRAGAGKLVYTVQSELQGKEH